MTPLENLALAPTPAMLAQIAHLEREVPGLPTIVTPRLRLRKWTAADAEPFAAINADARVAEHLPSTLTRPQSDAVIVELQAHIRQWGFGIWAVERLDSCAFIGFVGLNIPRWRAPFVPAVECAWRLGFPHWGQGFAREAMQEILRFSWDQLRLPYLLSWTVPANTRSWGLMERLGFARIGTFAHPKLPQEHALSPHLLYALAAPPALFAGDRAG